VVQVRNCQRAEEVLVLEMKRHKANMRMGLAPPPSLIHSTAPLALVRKSSVLAPASRFERLQEKSRRKGSTPNSPTRVA
jgi:hypothetical protein